MFWLHRLRLRALPGKRLKACYLYVHWELVCNTLMACLPGLHDLHMHAWPLTQA